MNPILQYTCKRIAVFSDIHSNYYALKACVEDAKMQGANCFIFLGDYVSGLADPQKTMDLVYELQKHYPTICIRGNRERSILEHHAGISVFAPGSHTGSYLYTYEQLRAKDLDFFAQLPFSTVVEINGLLIELAHATAEHDRYYFDKDDEKLQSVFQGMRTAYLVTGHSHKQYCCSSNHKTIINPGSVGLPQGNSWHAQYALLSIKDHKVICTFRQVAYDLEATIHRQFSSGLMERGKCWAICDLYGAIEGKEYTKALLSKIYQLAEADKTLLCDENAWEKCVAELDIAFTEEAAYHRLHQLCHS